MKFLVIVIFANFASLAYASPAETDALFESALESQQNAVELQQAVTEYAIRVRTAVPRVLGGRANGTIGRVEFNVEKLLEQEADTRTAIFALSSTNCVNNLRVLLDGITEFTGFESSNCVARYDLSMSELIQNTYDEVSAYEKVFGDAMRVVPGAFSAHNMFLEVEQIENGYSTRLDSLRARWSGERKNIGEFEEAFGNKIDGLSSTLQGCFNSIQVAVNPTYGIIANQITTCRSFDNSHDPFTFLQ